MKDSYNVLIEEINSIELIDKEVDWIDYYRQTNSFCNVKPINEHYSFSIVKFNSLKEQFENFYYCDTQADPNTYLTVKPHFMDLRRFSDILNNRIVEYNAWKEKKIKIKGVLLKNESIGGYVEYLKNLENEVVNDFRSIHKDGFNYLKIRRTDLNNVILSLMKLSNKFAIDHQTLGGTWITNPDNIEKKEAKYRNKFKIADLWSILEAEHFELKNGGLMQPKYDCVNPYFENNQGEKVYVTVDFLSDFQSVFQRRRETLDNIIKRLEFKFNIEPKIVVNFQNKEYSDKKYQGIAIALACNMMNPFQSEFDNISKGFNHKDENKKKQLENLITDTFKISEIPKRVYTHYFNSTNKYISEKKSRYKNQVIELVNRTNNTKAIQETNKFYETK